MSTIVVDPFHGEEGGVKVTVYDMPSLVCPQGHKRFIYAEFAALLMDLMVSPETFQKIPGAVKKGLFKKHFHCPACGMELPTSPAGRQTQDVIAELKKAQPFKVVVDMPVFKCSGCGKECIQSAEETAKLAFKGIGHAYRSIDIHPN
jgi:predicted RNA-binding Zn-ribbon protein involved in translation (DUF1610 family)